MNGRQATFAALAVALVGIAAFFLLDGVVGGIVLFAAGVLLVVIGIFGWQEPVAAAATVDGAVTVDQPLESSEDGSNASDEPARLEEPDETGAPDPPGTADPEPIEAQETIIEPEASGDDELAHVHDQPLLSHADLVTHGRDYHPDIPVGGSTIQLRLLHERAHGAPHELPST